MGWFGGLGRGGEGGGLGRRTHYGSGALKSKAYGLGVFPYIRFGSQMGMFCVP